MRNPKKIQGIGVNDATYPVSIHADINGKDVELWRCHFYRTWYSMLRRCNPSGEWQRIHPTYYGCSVVDEWTYFMCFREWMIGQPWEGNNLDKDILTPGNKIYGPSTCVFVDAKINTFILDSGSSRGEFPIGVNFEARRNKFRAKCSNPENGKQEHLGYFDCQDEAHQAWRRRKHELSCKYAEIQENPLIASALRARYA